MKLRARVRHITGATRHSTLPDATDVELEVKPSGVFLIRTAGDAFAGDTWHPTVEEAKAQAAFEFDIGEADWTEGP